jgi:class 3 adenylate cyclase
MGDKAWTSVLDRHYAKARHILGDYRGREVKTTGDGMVATFDGPARAIRCAMAIRDAAGAAELSVRAGLHTAEIERVGVDVGGIGVHVASRVADTAGANEVLVSRTVVDLVAGSGIEFEDRGEHSLKGVPGEWRLFVPVDR